LQLSSFMMSRLAAAFVLSGSLLSLACGGSLPHVEAPSSGEGDEDVDVDEPTAQPVEEGEVVGMNGPLAQLDGSSLPPDTSHARISQTVIIGGGEGDGVGWPNQPVRYIAEAPPSPSMFDLDAAGYYGGGYGYYAYYRGGYRYPVHYGNRGWGGSHVSGHGFHGGHGGHGRGR
jgi:hypothetical protein